MAGRSYATAHFSLEVGGIASASGWPLLTVTLHVTPTFLQGQEQRRLSIYCIYRDGRSRSPHVHSSLAEVPADVKHILCSFSSITAPELYALEILVWHELYTFLEWKMVFRITRGFTLKEFPAKCSARVYSSSKIINNFSRSAVSKNKPQTNHKHYKIIESIKQN